MYCKLRISLHSREKKPYRRGVPMSGDEDGRSRLRGVANSPASVPKIDEQGQLSYRYCSFGVAKPCDKMCIGMAYAAMNFPPLGHFMRRGGMVRTWTWFCLCQLLRVIRVTPTNISAVGPGSCG